MINCPLPKLENFKKHKNKNQLIYIKVIADKETPVSIFDKVCLNQPNSFLLESVTGGENKARYSIIGLNPDLIWESKGDECWIAESQDEVRKKHFNGFEITA